jgi:hypothetical protein
MSDVFLSYSKEDVSTARLISDKLGAAGFSVWWDRRIMPGKTWDEVIGASLDSASCVVVLWSKVSVQSRWVREEAERGADRGILVPIFIERVEPPLGFGRIEAADLSRWKGEATDPEFGNVCDAITSFLKAPRQKASKTVEVGGAPPKVTPPTPPHDPAPILTPQFFVGRWRVEDFNSGSDVAYLPDGTFSGVMIQNIGGYHNQMNAYGRWNIQILGPNMFRLQLWFADMTRWGGNFRVIDLDHIQNLELNYIASRVR